MVVKIQPPSPSAMIDAIIAYNERKADGTEGINDGQDEDIDSNGHIVATRNVPDDSTLKGEFDRLQVLNMKKTKGRSLQNAAFHMSVNPGTADKPLSETEMVSLIDEMMQMMGYGDCPYRIYKHTDIERQHYHVVSCRIGQDGKKINDSYENRRANRTAESLSEKYGYTVGSEEDSEKMTVRPSAPKIEEGEAAKEPAKVFVPPFSPEDSTPITDQFRAFHREAMQWTFTTPEQYMAILKWRYNCEVDELDGGFTYAGLDKKGKICTQILTESELSLPCFDEIVEKCVESDVKHLKSQRKRIETYAELAMKDCKTLKEFRQRMSKKGIYLSISFTEEGEPFGITWLDRATKCAFKGSETKVDLKWLKEKAAAEGILIQPTHKYERVQKSRPSTKVRCRAGAEVKRQMEQRKADALRRKIFNGRDEMASGNNSDSSELNLDPNNIKI